MKRLTRLKEHLKELEWKEGHAPAHAIDYDKLNDEIYRTKKSIKKETIKAKKPYFIPEPFGLPFELTPKGKYRKLK